MVVPPTFIEDASYIRNPKWVSTPPYKTVIKLTELRKAVSDYIKQDRVSEKFQRIILTGETYHTACERMEVHILKGILSDYTIKDVRDARFYMEELRKMIKEEMKLLKLEGSSILFNSYETIQDAELYVK